MEEAIKRIAETSRTDSNRRSKYGISLLPGTEELTFSKTVLELNQGR